MAGLARREAAALIHREARKFCSRETPKSDTELSRRQQQRMYLTSKIGTISHADLMARTHPSVSDQIMNAVKEFLERLELDDSPYEEATALTSKISTLCHSDLMQRL